MGGDAIDRWTENAARNRWSRSSEVGLWDSTCRILNADDLAIAMKILISKSQLSSLVEPFLPMLIRIEVCNDLVCKDDSVLTAL